MADLTAREFEAIFRCHNELLKNSNDSAASINRVALIFQVKLIFIIYIYLLPVLNNNFLG
jgi:hypothetical protein